VLCFLAGFNCTSYGPPVADSQQPANCTPQALSNTSTPTSPQYTPAPSPFQQPNNTFDRDNLRAIKAALGHPAFLSSWDGPYSMPCGSPGWHWLSCSPEGYVAEIRWPGMGLSGSMPHEFGLLRSLVTLDLSRNKLAGTIPGAFGTEGGLSWLRELDLSRNMLTGPLPAGFRALGELQTLDLSYNTFTVSKPRKCYCAQCLW
jgi:Leucine-rich repeat (LRR) protein